MNEIEVFPGDSTARLQKAGEQAIITTLRRMPQGLRVHVKAVGPIEECFQNWGTGEQQPVINHGRHWVAPKGHDPLRVWDMSKAPLAMASEDGTRFTLANVGMPLMNVSGRAVPGQPSGELNMSFLRLVGISSPQGVAFEVKSVFGFDEIRELASRIELAQRHIYIVFMRPVSISVLVSTQEIPR